MDDRQTEEIARIEHELARLRSTYGLMERRARMLKVCCQFVFVPIVIAMFVYLLVIDFVAGLFAIVFSSAVGSLLLFYGREYSRRWIDFAVPQSEGWWFRPSYAAQVEIWIGERESRLVQLTKILLVETRRELLAPPV